MTNANVVLFFVSAALTGGAVTSYIHVARRLGSWKQAQGIVTAIQRDQIDDDDGDGQHTMCAPMVRFRAGEGEFTFQDAIYTPAPRHEVGQRVPVLYDPANPSTATIAGWRPYLVTLACAVMGVVFLIVSLAG